MMPARGPQTVFFMKAKSHNQVCVMHVSCNVCVYVHVKLCLAWYTFDVRIHTAYIPEGKAHAGRCACRQISPDLP